MKSNTSISYAIPEYNVNFSSMPWLDLLKPTTVNPQPRFCQALWVAIKGVLFDVCGHLVVICNNNVVLFRLLSGYDESPLAFGLNKIASYVLRLRTHVVVIGGNWSKTGFSKESFGCLLSNLMVASIMAMMWLKAAVTDVFMLNFVTVVVGC